jgi:AMMECR1 domain-containing protein
LQVNSAVRTVEFQQHLVHINGNAAPAEGDTASPHLTGQAIDIAKHGLSLTEIAWLRGYLLPLVQEGKVDVEEEFQQSCFHISVYRKYLPPATTPSHNPATSRHNETTALAAAMR